MRIRQIHAALILLFFLCPWPSLAGSVAVARSAALTTASPYATQAGLEVLRRGGTAMDAAVAVSFALSVVHPQAGNIGGGGFLVYYEASSKGVWTLDFREVAPLSAKRDLFVGTDGKPIPEASRIGALSGGVPGTVAGLEYGHKRFGKLNWADLIAPSIRLASEGVRTEKVLADDVADAEATRKISRFPTTASLLFPEGNAMAAGTLLVQPELAETLARIARGGAADFYTGATSRKLIASMRKNGGLITERDLREYRPVWRAPIRIDFKEYAIYTVPPPSAGGVLLGEMLGILSPYDLAGYGFQSPRTIHLVVEAERRAYIDRNLHLADPASNRFPYKELLSPERARLWRSSILLDRATPTPLLTAPGKPESNHTTHISIVDAEGNIASLTTTLNDLFGSGLVIEGAGFFLNDAMDEFTTAPGMPNGAGLTQSEANSIQPGKRMVSSMTPTIVFKSGSPFLVLGSRGGPTIPTSVLQVFLNMAIHGKSLAEAVAAPRFHHQGYPDQIYYERGRAGAALLQKLNDMGHGVEERSDFGDVEAITIDARGLTAVSDPRYGGSAGGY